MTRLLSIALCVLCLASCGSTRPVLGSAIQQPWMIPVEYKGQEDYQLVQDWRVPGYNETIPKGLVVDGASVPRIFWSFMPPDGLHRGGALFHDWGYELRGHLRNGSVLTKADMDNALYNLMVQGGVSRKRAGTAHWAVDHFGQHAWNTVEEPVFLPVPNLATLSPVVRHRTVFSHIFAP